MWFVPEEWRGFAECAGGIVARVAVFPHNWAILKRESREKLRSRGLRFFGLYLLCTAAAKKIKKINCRQRKN